MRQNFSAILGQRVEEGRKDVRLPQHSVLVSGVFDRRHDEEEKREEDEHHWISDPAPSDIDVPAALALTDCKS